MIQRVQLFLSKFAMDVLRTIVASAVGALLFTHQWTLGSAPAPTQPAAASAGSSEQVAHIVRDEHDVMVQYLKAERARERAALEKEVRDAQAARIAQEAARTQDTRQAEAEPRKAVAPPRPIPVPRVASDNVPAVGGPAIAMSAPVPAVVGADPAGTAVASLPPPITITPLPEAATPASKAEAPKELTFAQKAAAATHVNDVVSFMRDVSGWFTHEDAPVPPADVRLSRFISASM